MFNSLQFPLKRFALAGAVTMAGLALSNCAPSEPGNVDTPPGNEQPSSSSAGGGSLFETTIEELQTSLSERRADGVPVPVPTDAGGGYTHEQHKQNAKTIYEASMLYQITGDDSYRDLAAGVLTDYADLYPSLDLHPKRREGHWPGRLFWQGLNEAWWLVYVIQGYDAIQEDLTVEQRQKIETDLLRPMAEFLSTGSPRTFNRIHNHATWAAAAVGMTGYVLDEQDYVDRALYGLDKSGDVGFLKQVDLLFSPDGYYSEGPYYQRYALMPYVLFAHAIQKNDPDLGIFERREEVLQKAITSTVQQSYGGRFFPINDAIREKGLNTAELRYAIAIAYDLTGDGALLDIVERHHKSIVPTLEGKAMAEAIAAGKTKPFPYKSLKLSDGPDGDRGALIALRSGPEPDAAAVVFKATSQGLGHGHFDRLGLLYYDNGDEIVADYGASRFLNVEPKNGGHYLRENQTWAKQTIAHNTLVVDQSSQFGGDWKRGEEFNPNVLAFDDAKGKSFAAAEINDAYDGVGFQRIVAMIDRPAGGSYVIDIVRARSNETHTYDLPVHFKGQLIETGIPFNYATNSLRPLGADAGYQHLWKTAEASGLTPTEESNFSFLIDNQFYTLTFASDTPLNAYLTRLGANDPNNNLRNEQALILRADGANATFLSVYERHGRYDNDEEVTVFNGSSVENLTMGKSGDIEIYAVKPKTGDSIQILFSPNPDKTIEHSVSIAGKTITWRGPVGLHVAANQVQNND